MKMQSYLLAALTSALFFFHATATASGVERIGLYGVYELTFSTSARVDNPFDTYLLRVEVTGPDGRAKTIDGFFAGDGKGGQNGSIWKARICPDKGGRWGWRTVPGDDGKNHFENESGEFICYDNGSRGGLVAQGKYFKYRNGPFVYLQGNFLDWSNGPEESTHVYMGEGISDDDRRAILKKQLQFHKVNKINLYLANRGDYKRKKVTPWLKTDAGVDIQRMDLRRWMFFEECIAKFGAEGLFAEIWFFADDSQFGRLSKKEKEILFRYGMARLSALNNTFFVICLEWNEEWRKDQINEAGKYIQAKNPWGRLLSVHGLSIIEERKSLSFRRLVHLFKKLPSWEFSEEKWPTFIATQVGNRSTAKEVNQIAVEIHSEQSIPHLSEEFGILRRNSDKFIRAKMWANFCGGAAGGGTGSDIASLLHFIEKSHIPFQRMKPDNTLLTENGDDSYCLAEVGENYVVYSEKGRVTLRIDGSDMRAYWYNVRENSPPFLFAGTVENRGEHEFMPPDIENDWVLWVTQNTLDQ
jgi:hypothetical protein